MTSDKPCFVCNKPAGVEVTALTLGLCHECAPYFTDDMRERIEASTSWITAANAEIALARALKAEERAEWLQEQLTQAAIARSDLASQARHIATKRDQFERQVTRMHYALVAARQWIELTKPEGDEQGERLVTVINQALERDPKPPKQDDAYAWEVLGRAFPSGRMRYPEDLKPWSDGMFDGLKALEAMTTDKGPNTTRALGLAVRAVIWAGQDNFGAAFKWQNGDLMTFNAWAFAVVLGLKDTDILGWHDFKKKRLESFKEMARSYLELLPESQNEDVRRVIDTFGVSWDARL